MPGKYLPIPLGIFKSRINEQWKENVPFAIPRDRKYLKPAMKIVKIRSFKFQDQVCTNLDQLFIQLTESDNFWQKWMTINFSGRVGRFRMRQCYLWIRKAPQDLKSRTYLFYVCHSPQQNKWKCHYPDRLQLLWIRFEQTIRQYSPYICVW